MLVEAGFLNTVKFNLLCSLCIIKSGESNIFLDSFSNVKFIEGCIALHSVSALFIYVLFCRK
jgi:hypothetical protein